LRIRLKDDFGISVSGIDIGTIDFDQNSPGYKKLMQVTADIATQTIQAQSEVNIKEMFDKQRIEAENYAETLRIQREEEQYAQHKQTQSANFSVYQIEAQTEVGVAAATALGNMDTNSTGDSSGNGFNPVSMMAGMAIGGTMGQNIANTMNSILSATAQPAANTPPIPDCVYHVAINGRASGPFGKDILSQMILSGQVTENTLVWTTGMADWAKAQSIPEIRSLFNIIPPQLPQE